MEKPYEIVFKEPASREEFIDAVKYLIDMTRKEESIYPRQRIELEFFESGSVIGMASQRRTYRKVQLGFFTSTLERFCYKINRRANFGYSVEKAYIDYDKVFILRIYDRMNPKLYSRRNVVAKPKAA